LARFDGRVGISTGSASGIGKQVALRLAAEGGIPVIADLDLKAAEATAGEIRARKSDAFAVAMNVTDEAQVEKGVAGTVAKYGKVDILVSAAGIGFYVTPHGLRHAHASWLLAGGADVQVVKERLLYTATATTEKYSALWWP